MAKFGHLSPKIGNTCKKFTPSVPVPSWVFCIGAIAMPQLSRTIPVTAAALSDSVTGPDDHLATEDSREMVRRDLRLLKPLVDRCPGASNGHPPIAGGGRLPHTATALESCCHRSGSVKGCDRRGGPPRSQPNKKLCPHRGHAAPMLPTGGGPIPPVAAERPQMGRVLRSRPVP